MMCSTEPALPESKWGSPWAHHGRITRKVPIRPAGRCPVQHITRIYLALVSLRRNISRPHKDLSRLHALGPFGS